MRAVAAVVVSLAAVVAGCGGGVSSAKNAEARLAGAFDTLRCDARAMSSQTGQEERTHFRSLVSTDGKLPRVAKLVSDANAEDKLRAAIRKTAEAPGYKPGALKNDLAAIHRLRVEFSADEKALGFRCITPPQETVVGDLYLGRRSSPTTHQGR